ncbi:LPXTG cell wall anchor domain-containing protein [Streptomyces alkaliphilus]|uniref:LPXTG cell wall anchor domain-containing protein n=1 Tax=Streptomyces alkaliphilus TaxID=1472722 RepID=A0A7W3TDV7_9ACTN|nr:LPXTG cell wall anchor domain-containing protein [Streptomyces alkaliphilus]MBB0244987.1 LPXTG cell wall anchor domain-containing protein [Streptomyces alkaliphilus]
MRIFSVKGALAASAAAAMILLGAAPASATSTWEGSLHKDHRGATAESFPTKEKTCPGVSKWKDGWHFVTRGNAEFVELEATFEKAGEVTLTTFGPPSDKHAYIATPVGDVLIDATAVLKASGPGAKQKTFNLSHTCPGKEKPGDTTGGGTTGDTGDTTEGSTGDTTEGQTSEGTTGDTTEGTTTEGQTSEGTTGDSSEGTTTEGQTTEGTTGDTTEGTTGDTTEGTTEGTTGDEGTEGTTGDTTEGTTGVTPDGGSDTPDLANTGSNTPVIGASVLAAALLGVGGYMAMRRRNAAGRA